MHYRHHHHHHHRRHRHSRHSRFVRLQTTTVWHLILSLLLYKMTNDVVSCFQ